MAGGVGGYNYRDKLALLQELREAIESLSDQELAGRAELTAWIAEISRIEDGIRGRN